MILQISSFMGKMSPVLGFFLGILVSSAAGACTPQDSVCVFRLDISEELTMVHGADPVKLKGGKLYKYSENRYTNQTEIPLNQVITGDGWPESRRVTVFNKQMPGPTLAVYQGQTVIVHVTNSLSSDTTAIHWYGLEQKGTPWMDGVDYITQCPILPGESFTYTFKADQKGTYWYHSTVAGQAMDGAFGPFIVYGRTSSHSREFVMTLQDWNHSWDSQEMELKRQHGWLLNGNILPSSTSPTGSKYTMLRVDSGLVNGRGRYSSSGSHKDGPLSKFEIQQGLDYRFRTIHAGSMLPFRVSVDSHMLTIVALDGVEVVPVTVESFIISPGERVDFIIYGDNAVSNYWIRGEALEAKSPRVLSAILHYKGARDSEPSSNRKSCSADDLCLILNCPFADFTPEPNTKCIPVDMLKSAKPNPMLQGSPYFKELFLNFAFPGYDDKPGSVNGHAFDRYPHVPPLTQKAVIPCDASACGTDKVCHCPLVLNLQQGTQLQLVLINMGQGKGWDQPVHIHGHHMSILKTGFANYDTKTGLFRGDNLDVDCLGNPNRELNFCNSATWGNPTWLRGNIPGINLQNPPQKDTVVIPNGGYVVVRLRADNPGLWLMHSVIEPHLKEGMAMLFNETYSAIPAVPKGFPTCGDFNPNPLPTKGQLPVIG